MIPIDPESQRLRLSAVTAKAIRGGAERWLLEVLANSSRLDTEFLILEDGWLAQRARSLGFPVSTIPTGRRLAELISASVRTGAAMRQFDADAILLNGSKPGLVALPWGWLTGRRTIYVKHGAQHDRTLNPVLARMADRCIAVSVAQAEMLPAGRTTIVSPPRPPIGPPRPTPPDHRPLTLVMLCRIFPSKGIDTAIEAIATMPDWDLVVGGPDDPASPGERARLLQLADEVGAAARVRFVGEVDDPDALLRSADAAAILSRPWGPSGRSSEGYGMVAVEAAAAGVPVIADPDRIPSVHALGGRGVVPIRGDDVGSVRAALGGLKDVAVRSRLGEEGRSAVLAIPDATEAADLVAALIARTCLRPGDGLRNGPAISVIVPILNEAGVITELLRYLLPQLRGGPQGADELICVDNGSTDGTWEQLLAVADADERVTAIRAERGTSRARNAGARVARNHWLAFTDAGCRPSNRWLDSLRAGAATGDFDLLTGVSTVASDGRAWQEASALAAYPTLPEIARPDAMVRLYRKVFGLGVNEFAPAGRSLAVSRSMFEEVGGFPEDMITAEDVEFGMKIRDSGGRACIVVGAVVDWDQRSSLVETWRMYRRYGEGDGLAGRPVPIARSLTRVTAYGIGSVVLSRRGIGRWMVLAGAGLYMSLPLRRAVSARTRPAVIACMPAMMAVKDFGKAIGCARGMWARARGRPQVT